MEPSHVLVGFNPDQDMKTIIEDHLSNLASLTYLPAAEDRTAAIETADIILSWNPPREFADDEYALMKRARFMQLLSAGADHLRFSLFPETLAVAGNVGAYAQAMAEHVMAMTLALAKNLMESNKKLAAGNFDQQVVSRSLHGATCAILGFGGIGKATASLMRAFGVRILAVNTSGKTDEEVDFIGTTEDLQYVLSHADIVVVSMPLSRSTKGLIGERELTWMKPDAILVNVARGEIIDEQALYEHLKSHPEFKAGIDAWWVEPFRHGRFEVHYPFLELPNVLGTPHNSGMVPEAMAEATRQAVQNIERFIAGESVKGLFRREEYLF
ncbi:MAG: 2-hydroxyacid dehydrogenase [Candidatus Cryosericum sp.]